MPAFEYTALDDSGRNKKGVIEGDSPKSARQLLRSQGLTPLDIHPIAQKDRNSKRQSFLSLGKRMSASELALFTRQLATLLQAGTPLEEALRTTAKQSEKSHVTRTILGVRSKVTEGHSLENGLAEFPATFPDLYRATVAAGEKSGNLDPVLERLADYTESRQEMQQNVTTALVYPIVLLIICIGVVVGLLTYVVPQVVQVFADLGNELPLPTRVLLASSDFLRATWWYWIGAIVAGIFIFKYLMKTHAFKNKFHSLQLRLPIVGRLIRGLNTSRFARTLSILTASGVPVLEALRIASHVIPNLPMKKAVNDAAVNVREGASIHGSLETSKHFPPMTLHLIASGEASGNLEIMLERAAVQQERELKTVISATLSLFEPLMIVFMGGLVFGIVIAIMLPLFEMNQLVG
ncbi:MAG: type II secretion system inner membrane protein GspF [Gammaproteobacteria bacterium]